MGVILKAAGQFGLNEICRENWFFDQVRSLALKTHDLNASRAA
jgi:hypothetical protein